MNLSKYSDLTSWLQVDFRELQLQLTALDPPFQKFSYQRPSSMAPAWRWRILNGARVEASRRYPVAAARARSEAS